MFANVILYLLGLTASLSVSISQGLLAVLILLMFIYLYKNKIDITRDNIYFIPFFTYWLATNVAIFTGFDGSKSIADLFRCWTLLVLFATYYLVNEKNIRWLFLAIALGSLALGTSQIYDYITGTDGRGAGFISSYMMSGNVIALGATFIFAIIVSGYDTVRFRVAYGIIFLVAFVGLLATGTRGALLAFLAAASLLLVYRFKIRGVISAIVLLILAGVGAYFTDILGRFLEIFKDIDDPTTSHGWRLLLWKNSINIIKEYPIFGAGAKNFETLIREYMPISNIAKGHAHNGIIQLLAINGVAGLLTFLWFYGTVVYTFIKNMSSSKYAVIGFFITITFIVEGFTENSYPQAYVKTFHALVVGACLAMIVRGKKC